MPPRQRIVAIALSIVALAWCVGAADFLRADGSLTWAMPRQATPPSDEHNLASYAWGPTLRASSYYRDQRSHHHPAFLVDGVDTPSQVEKWTSSLPDRSPWIEVHWREPRALMRVVIFHGGWREGHFRTSRTYRVSCLTDHGEGAARNVPSNQEDVAHYDLPCAGARGVRIAWQLAPGDDVVRVYEVEAWGR